MAVGQPEAELDDPLLPVGQGGEDVVQLVLQHDERRRLDRHHRVGVLDEVAEVGVLLADRRLERHGLLGDALDLHHAVDGQVHLQGDLLGSGLPAEILVELPLHPHELVDRLDHVHGNSNGARLVRDRPGDRLANPPRGIRGELISLGVVEFLDRPDETQVALLDQIEEEHSAPDIAFRDRHHEPEIGLDEPLLRPDALPDELLELGLGEPQPEIAQLVLGEQARLDGLGQLHLLLGRQQRNPADLPQVDADEVAGRRPLADVLLIGADGVLLRLRLEHLHTLFGEHPHDAFQRVGRQLGAVKRGGHVVDGDAPALPSSRD